MSDYSCVALLGTSSSQFEMTFRVHVLSFFFFFSQPPVDKQKSVYKDFIGESLREKKKITDVNKMLHNFFLEEERKGGMEGGEVKR